jgi:hypothetical protein
MKNLFLPAQVFLLSSSRGGEEQIRALANENFAGRH